MKKILSLPFLFVMTSLIFLTSCKKDIEDRLPGDWSYNYEYIISSSNTGESEKETITGKISFDEDGTGTWIMEGDVIDITWAVKEKTVTIYASDNAVVYNAITNEKDKQVWEKSSSFSNDDIIYTEKFILTLTK
jgi:hypothetical protein